MHNSELQAQAAGLMAAAQGEAQVKVQQELAQIQNAQAQAQAAPQPGGTNDQGTQSGVAGAGQGVSNTSFGGLGGQEGFNPAMGGGSATTGAPTMGREQINQETMMQGQ